MAAVHICLECGQVVWGDELAELPDRDARTLLEQARADRAVSLKLVRGDTITDADIRGATPEFIRDLLHGAALADKRGAARRALAAVQRREKSRRLPRDSR